MAELEAEVERWLRSAENTGAAEDGAFGRDKSGEELPKLPPDRRCKLLVRCSTDFFGVHDSGSRAKARNEAESSR